MDFSSWKRFPELLIKDDRLVILTLLIDIGTNLMTNPDEPQHRLLPRLFIEETFSSSPSAISSLQSMGFEQINGDFHFTSRISSEELKEIVEILENELIRTRNEEKFPLIDFDRIRIGEEFSRLIPLISTLKQIQSYENEELKELIRRSIIPHEEFRRKFAQRKSSSSNFDEKDFLLIELLRWFKEEFFTWFDQPDCQQCQQSMTFRRFDRATKEEFEQGDAQKVEIYRCSKCSDEFRFPRYNRISMLLKTRRGRCGEAANLFTCFCRALDLESRYIYDTTDHVWTEVYSFTRKQWIHCDSCENLLDSPLLYEQGWKKQLLFCIAFARDHLEDVTWRYVSHFQQTIEKRNINEKRFAKTISSINRSILKHFPSDVQSQILSRRIRDLTQMLKERQISKDSELMGRQSGSTQWRLARQEIQAETMNNGFIYFISENECSNGSIEIEYDSVQDQYYRNQSKENVQWKDRLFSLTNIQRKVEKDWKVVYLARQHLFSPGKVSWRFQLNSSPHQFDQIRIRCPTNIFDEFTRIASEIVLNDDEKMSISFDSNNLFQWKFPPTKNGSSIDRIQLNIVLNNSNDENDSNAWQKGQLFRQSILSTNKEHFFLIHISLSSKQQT